MIAVMTNAGALEFGRSLSGGTRFLAYEVALLNGQFNGLLDAASLSASDVDLSLGKIGGKDIVQRFKCTGALPVKVSSNDGGNTTEAYALDIDFNGQAPLGDGGTSTSFEYWSVVALGYRFSEYKPVVYGHIYNIGDHVWANDSAPHEYAYVCITDNFTYAGIPPKDDSEHWMALPVDNLIGYPGNSNLFADPDRDIVPFFVTSYDESVKMANGMEWEYKVRVFLDNVVSADLSKLDYFSYAGLEVSGSLMLTFLANISEQFRTIREQISTVS